MRWKSFGLRQPLRLACLLTALLVLAQPRVQRLQEGLDLWVLVDRSASATDHVQPRLQEWESLLERGMGADDRIFYVDFADETMLRGDGEGATFTGNRNRTRIAGAVRFALGRMASRRAARLLVFTDGYSTEPSGDLATRLIEQQVALDYRLAGGAGGPDYRVEEFSIPHRVQINEPFLMEIRVAGTPDARVPYLLSQNGTRVAQGEVEIQGGRGMIRLAERIGRGGSYQYELQLHPEIDTHPGNNRSQSWIEIAGGPRILLITGYTNDPLIPILQNQGFEVDAELAPRNLSTGRLSGARAVIINNISADQLPSEFIDALDFFVRFQGGGLMMAGGKRSFGAGGYYRSTIEELLPVTTELRQEHRRLAAAMAIVMDRSGSMSMTVAGGRSKMDLANDGAAKTIELLGNGDAITVIAVDSQPHIILPLTTIENDTVPLTRAVRRIASAGGGIYVYNGLEAAWRELQQAQQGQRHVILFADAADSEQPGSYQALLAEMRREGATVSVIGLGHENDSDAAFLKDIAERGGGRIFFNADPNELPAIFAQETVAVARSAFIDEPAGFQPTAGWLEIAARHPEWVDAVDGYNLSYLKPDATAGAFSGDENDAPLVAFWHRGIGRTAAVSFPLAGDFSQRIRSWNGYGDFIQTLSRWLAGEDAPPGVGLRTAIDGEELILELFYTDERERDIATNPPRLLLARGESGEAETLIWERMEPGHYQARTALEPEVMIRGAAQVGNHALPFGPIVLGRSAEWDFRPQRLEELRQLSRLSGGEERLDLSEIWQSPRRLAYSDLRLPLLLLLLLLFLIEAAWTRIGGRWPFRTASAKREAPGPARPKIRKRKQAIPAPALYGEPDPATPKEKPASPEPSPSPAPGPSLTDEERRQRRFARAKRRGL